MNSPIGIVLAAGKGKRMKSDLPKVLNLACGKPLIKYVIDALRSAGVGKIIAIVGYRENLVRAALQNETMIEFATQTDQLGTGHAVMMCRTNLAGHEGPTVVVAGDSPMIQPQSLKALLDDFRRTRPACLLGTLIHPNPVGLGRIVRNQRGQFLKIVEEKDASAGELQIAEVNMSTYVFDNQRLLAALCELTADNRQKEYYITDLPAILLRQGFDVRAIPVLKPIEALSVNTVEELAQVEAALSALSEQASRRCGV